MYIFLNYILALMKVEEWHVYFQILDVGILETYNYNLVPLVIFHKEIRSIYFEPITCF